MKYPGRSGVAAGCPILLAPRGANDADSSVRRLARLSIGRSGTAMGGGASLARWDGGTRGWSGCSQGRDAGLAATGSP